ncbi:MAG: alpha/beta hydrolase, partial [Bdellovibrionota bacterium]
GVDSREIEVTVLTDREAIHILEKKTPTCTTTSAGGSEDPRLCPCIALVHGFGDQAMSWRKILTAESSRLLPCHYVALDLPGSGDSPPPRPGHDHLYTIENYARTLRAVLEKTCSSGQPVTLVGNSMGGWVVTHLALNWPDRVSKLLLLSPGGLKVGDHSALEFLSGEPSVEKLQEFQRRAYFKAREIPPQIWRKIVDKAKEESAETARMLNARKVNGDSDYLDGRLPTLKAQTILFWGKADRIIPPTDAKIWKAYAPGIIVREVERCGHMPQKECPAEVLRSLHDLGKIGPS